MPRWISSADVGGIEKGGGGRGGGDGSRAFMRTNPPDEDQEVEKIRRYKSQ
jgi:hypothetical protein